MSTSAPVRLVKSTHLTARQRRRGMASAATGIALVSSGLRATGLPAPTRLSLLLASRFAATLVGRRRAAQRTAQRRRALAGSILLGALAGGGAVVARRVVSSREQ